MNKMVMIIIVLVVVVSSIVRSDVVFNADFGTANNMRTNGAVDPETIAGVLNAGTSTGSWSSYQENFTQPVAIGTIANAEESNAGFEFRLTSGDGQGGGLLGTIRANFEKTLDFSANPATICWDWYRVDNFVSVRGEVFAYNKNGSFVYGLQMRDGYYFETVDGVNFSNTGITCANTSSGSGAGEFNPGGLQSVSLEFSSEGVLINGSVISGLELDHDEIDYVTCGIRAENGLKFGIVWDNLTAEGSLAPLYVASDSLPIVSDGAMPGLADGFDAFFTFAAVFDSFTFSADTNLDQSGGVDGPDRMVLFESGGSGKGISLTLDDSGVLYFRSGSSTLYQEASVDLASSLLPTDIPVYVVAAFNATDDAIDLYINSTNKTATASLNGNTALAGTDGYGIGARSNGLGAYDRATLDDYHFLFGAWDGDEYTNSAVMVDNLMLNFTVYSDLKQALATIPEEGDLLTTFVVEPSEVYQAEPVVLSWVVDPEVDSVTIHPSVNNTADMLISNTLANGVGTITAYPSSNTVYQLLVAKGVNMDTGTVEVIVNPMSIIDFSASATKIYAGESVSLVWNVPGSESISIGRDLENIVTTNVNIGSVSIEPPLGDSVYVLTVSNRFGVVLQSNVTVVAEYAASVVTIISSDFTNGVYNSNGSFEFGVDGVELTSDYQTPGLWQVGNSGLGSVNNKSVDKVVARNNAGVADGSHALVIGGDTSSGLSGGVLDTGYVVKNGDSFELSFWFDPLADWYSPESLDVILFTSSDDTMSGSLTAIMATNINDGATDITQYVYNTSEVSSDSPHVGKKLWIEFSGASTQNSLVGFARVDNVQLTAVSIDLVPADIIISFYDGQVHVASSNLVPISTHQVQWKEDLMTGEWSDVGEPVTGSTSVMLDFPATNSSGFYRVISQ